MCKQCVEWGGVTWHLYRNYYERTVKSDGKKWTEVLHRESYRAHNGAIPEGHDIHHIDGNPRNNEPSNLLAVTRSDHLKLHADQAILAGEAARKIERNRVFVLACAECGTSIERRRRTASPMCKKCSSLRAEGRRKTPTICACCGSAFESRNGNYCSQRCVNISTHGGTRSVLPPRGRAA